MTVCLVVAVVCIASLTPTVSARAASARLLNPFNYQPVRRDLPLGEDINQVSYTCERIRGFHKLDGIGNNRIRERGRAQV